MKRLVPDNGPNPDDQPDPYSPEGLAEAQEDRLLQMAVYGLDEEDFGDEAVWLPEESE